MACKRFVLTKLRNRNVIKLVCGFGFCILTTYFVTYGLYQEDRPSPADDIRPLRRDVETVLERRMLNANEDSLESLRAPTPRPGHLAKAHAAVDIPAPAHTGDDDGAKRDQPRPIGNRITFNNSNKDVQAQGGGNPNQYANQQQRNENSLNNLQENSQKTKMKQWEVYDYENPNNLLQIHVDRAPEHAEGVGLPWPMPQNYLTEQKTHIVDVNSFRIIYPKQSCARVNQAIDRYTNHINSKVDLYVPDGETLRTPQSQAGLLAYLKVSLSRSCEDKELPHEHMSEQYKLRVTDTGAELSAQEVWGLLRGLETFSQLIYYDKGYARINNTHIKDYPRFRFRGLMVDTARHYIPVKHIKRTLDAMSYNKLNVFHWHMVDDQSFPFVSKVFPKLSELGAYSPQQVYTYKDILELIDYAADRGIRVVPEFDSPGHTRSWGLGYPKLLTNCSAQFHPFGAVNPISNYTYDFMNKFWAEVHSLFPDSMVHVGGDEINYKCWLKLRKIRQFMLDNNMTVEQYDYFTLDGDKLQGFYLKHLLEVMPKDRKKIAWEEAFNAAQQWNVSMDELIINVWKGGDYEWQYTIENVIRHGYKAILSAPWYLNYISYGKDWTKYYEQDPHSFLTYSSGADTYKDYVIGGQVCMWAEYIDETNLEATLWPRASAPAEKFWSAATMNDWKRAEVRFENHRCRMTRRGVRAQPISGPGSCKGKMRIKPPYDANNGFF